MATPIQFAFYNPATGYMDTAALTSSTQLAYLKLTGDATGTVGLDLSSHHIIGVIDPTAADHAANKSYVDAVAAGLSWKQAVRVATVASMSLQAPGATIDGVTMAVGNRVLVKNQAGAAADLHNGIYIYQGAAAALTRAPDFDGTPAFEVGDGAAVFVNEGTQASSGWTMVTPDPITVGTTPMQWTQFTALGSITVGNGLTQNASTISVGDGAGIAVTAGTTSLDVAAGALYLTSTGSAGQLQFRADGTRGITVDNTLGAYLKVHATGAVTFSGGDLFVITDGARGMAKDASGLFVKVDGSGSIQTVATGLAVKLTDNGGFSGLTSSAAGLAVKVDQIVTNAIGSNGDGLIWLYGNGLTVLGGVAYAQVDAAHGMQLDANGIGVLTSSNGGLEFNGSSGIRVKLDTVGAVTSSANGLGLNVSLSGGLQIIGNLLQSKVQGAIGVDASGLKLNINGAGGLHLTGTNLEVVTNAAQFMHQDAQGIGLTVSTTGGLVSAGTDLGLFLNPSGSLRSDVTGASVKLNGATLHSDASGLDVLGVPSLFTINGVATAAGVTAANLNTLVGGSNADSLHTHTVSAVAKVIGVALTGSGVAAGTALYYSAAGTVSAASNNTVGHDNVIGVATDNAGNFVRQGIVQSVLAGAAAGTAYYLGTAGTPVTAGTLTTGQRVIRLGYALNTTDLDVRIEDVGVRP